MPGLRNVDQADSSAGLAPVCAGVVVRHVRRHETVKHPADHHDGSCRRQGRGRDLRDRSRRHEALKDPRTAEQRNKAGKGFKIAYPG
jgi:hypothetical protein